MISPEYKVVNDSIFLPESGSGLKSNTRIKFIQEKDGVAYIGQFISSTGDKITLDGNKNVIIPGDSGSGLDLNKLKESKYILGYISKSMGFTNPTVYAFEEEQQFVFESIMFSAMNLYANGGASKSKLAESHKRWENELNRKNEEKMTRTQELNTAKILALKELGYTEITEQNASEVFDKIAEIQSRATY